MRGHANGVQVADMEEHEHHQELNQSQESWLNRHRWIGYGALIVIAYYLLTEHQEHIIAFYPYLFLASCALINNPLGKSK